MAEGVHLPDFLLLDPVQRIEPANLAGDRGGVARRIELRDRAHTAAPGDQTVPG